MAAEFKTSFRAYAAWNYEKEIEDLNRASEEGWQLVKGGCFHSRFIKNPSVRYRYQLDYGKIEDLPRYMETFREQGWEYVNSTFNGWHYLRKLYDPSLPEEEYEIFTDRQSLQEMTHRWATLAGIIGILLGLNAIVHLIRMVRTPSLPILAQLLLFAVESLVLLRGVWIMRRPETRMRKESGAFLLTFFLVLLVGLGCFFYLSFHRPHVGGGQQTASITEPIRGNTWNDFEVSYPDNYYLDLKIKAEKPLTFSVINEAGEAVYSVTETDFEKENIRIRLPKGSYALQMDADSGFFLDVTLD